MDYRKALLVALFTITISQLGISEDVPDDVVYTEMKKTLVNGIKGVLTCEFKGAPNAVYWKKGSSPENAPLIMTWTYGKKFGPRYEDGSCDIDENYSLIIKNVTHEDEGRYICRVSTYKGVLKYNFTDVTTTDIAAKTEANVSVQRGKIGVLPCKILIRPRKVSWGKGINSTLVTMDVSRGVLDISGPGYEGGWFNMTEDYSLFISDVTLQHGENYFCEVTEFYTDSIYRDHTVLSVYVPPTTPFPIIEGCPFEDHTNCIITTGSSITLTCRMNEYYPDINLFFMHGSKRVESIDTKIWKNTDGTKSRSVTISARKSKDVYKCIASGVPGFDLNKEISSTVRVIQERNISIILPVVLIIVVLCLTAVLLTWMRLRKRSSKHGKPLSKEERYIEDHISFVELWQLVEYITDNRERGKFIIVLKSLNGNKELTNMNQDEYYKELCRWKEACAQTVNQRTTLYDKCFQFDLDKSLKQLEDFRNKISAEVPTHDLEHILWQINEPEKITDFLKILGLKDPPEMPQLGKKSFIKEAVDQLVSWTKDNLTYNPVVVLSSTLEKMGMCTADNNFFQVPKEEKTKISEDDVGRFGRDLSRNHCQKLHNIIKSTGAGIEILPTKIVSENMEVLFNIEKMLWDWWEDVECSNYDKRRALEHVCRELSNDIQSTEAYAYWLSDEELEIISRYLDPTSMATLSKKRHITALPEAADEKGRSESVSESEWMTEYGHLRAALGKVGILGLLPPLGDKPIHKAEYVDIAFELLMTDVIPVARTLGISDDKLPVYRPIFEPAHLKKGTIGLVTHLVESTKKGENRLELCSRLRKAGFPLAIAKNILVYRMAYGELHGISEAMKSCRCKQTEDDGSHGAEIPPGERDSFLCKDNITSIEMETRVEKAQEEETTAQRHFSEIKKMLKLTDEHLNRIPKECLDEFSLFRIWKDTPHLALFNDRAAIIQQLFDMKRDDIARSVAEGNYYNTGVSLPFVQCIVRKMKEDEMLRFAETFKLKKKVEGAQDIDDLANKIIKLCIIEIESGVIQARKPKECRALVDKLVENGFLDIARELNIINR